jgi:dipeptidyl aminopeptidase/acylaminoacyl peptidase
MGSAGCFLGNKTAGHSSPFSAVVSEWSFTSTVKYVVVSRRDNTLIPYYQKYNIYCGNNLYFNIVLINENTVSYYW